MDISESTRILFDKIQKLEPENVTKIIGYLLLRDHGDEDIVQLAMAPDHLLHEVVFKAKTELQRLPNKSAMAPISPPMNPPHVLTHLPAVSPRTFRSPGSFLVPSAYWDPQLASNINSDFIAPGYMDSILELQNQNQSQSQLYGLKNQLEPVKMGISGLPHDYYYLDNASGNLNGRGHHRFSSLPEFPVKTCHYFSRGFCKHGSSCRYYHDQVQPESFSQMYDDDQVFSPGSLAQLELELIELLKPRRGNPLSIASLPLVYYDKYKKVLQADGYLTESQRHGKTGYSLTKLLARLKNSICIIDRPHGQHAVILAEDAPKYMEYRSVKNDPGQIVSASRQIYLTFPAESTFTEDDVSNYFCTFGPVEDVRIPCQQKRMFGFVTFNNADTVKAILQKGNPHFVHGSRVLVKPYREKSKLVDRKYTERFEHPVYYSPQYADLENELNSVPRDYEASRFLGRQLLEEQEEALEFGRRHLSAVQLSQKPVDNPPYIDFSLDGLKVSDHFNFQSAECFSFGLDDKPRNADTSYADQDSNQGLNLPDSPFASPIANGISTVI